MTSLTECNLPSEGCLLLDFPKIDIERVVDIAADHIVRDNSNHVNIKKRAQDSGYDAVHIGRETLADPKRTKYLYSESEWTEYREPFIGSYVHEVCLQLEDYIKQRYNLNIGRIRFNLLPAKSCLTLHQDKQETHRFHIPIMTNDSCFFVNNMRVYQMLTEGALYAYSVREQHTAVNASREPRVHLVLSTYETDH